MLAAEFSTPFYLYQFQLYMVWFWFSCLVVVRIRRLGGATAELATTGLIGHCIRRRGLPSARLADVAASEHHPGMKSYYCPLIQVPRRCGGAQLDRARGGRRDRGGRFRGSLSVAVYKLNLQAKA